MLPLSSSKFLVLTLVNQETGSTPNRSDFNPNTLSTLDREPCPTGRAIAPNILSKFDWIWSVAISPDGTTLASGSDDKTVKLWDIRTGECLKTLDNGTNFVRSVAFSPDGKMLVCNGSDYTVKLWDISTGKILKVLQGHNYFVNAVTYSPDGQMLASASYDQTVRLWDARTGDCLKILQGHTNSARSVSFSPDSKILASCSNDETIKLWDVKTGECLKTLIAERPYEGMNITDVSGLTDAEKATIESLGAVSDRPL